MSGATGKKIPMDVEALTLSVSEDVPTVEVETVIALSVEYVKVIPPPDREDDVCSIYGHISVNDRDSEPFVTIYNRPQHNPQTVPLYAPKFRHLTLSADHSYRSLRGGYPIMVKMKLWEKLPETVEEEEDGQKQKQKQEDPLIADIDFRLDDCCYKVNKRSFFEFEGEGDDDSGFLFRMAYANIYGANSVKVKFTINHDKFSSSEERGGEDESLIEKGKRKLPNSIQIYGGIGAVQELGEPVANTPIMDLYYRTENDPGEVEFGSPIDLDRNIVVAPSNGVGVLCIAYDLYCYASRKLFAHNVVPFPFHREAGCITVPKDLTFTKQADGGLVSISVTFIPHRWGTRSGIRGSSD